MGVCPGWSCVCHPGPESGVASSLACLARLAWCCLEMAEESSNHSLRVHQTSIAFSAKPNDLLKEFASKWYFPAWQLDLVSHGIWFALSFCWFPSYQARRSCPAIFSQMNCMWYWVKQDMSYIPGAVSYVEGFPSHRRTNQPQSFVVS